MPWAAKQVVNSAIVTHVWGSHLGRFQDPGVIHGVSPV